MCLQFSAAINPILIDWNGFHGKALTCHFLYTLKLSTIRLGGGGGIEFNRKKALINNFFFFTPGNIEQKSKPTHWAPIRKWNSLRNHFIFSINIQIHCSFFLENKSRKNLNIRFKESIKIKNFKLLNRKKRKIIFSTSPFTGPSINWN